MGIPLGASVLIDHERGRLDLSTRVRGREAEELFLSVVTASELLHGVHRASDPGVLGRRSAFVEAVLDRFSILSLDLGTARAHARLWAHLAVAGSLIGAHDLWLAVSCLAHGLALATGHPRELEGVPGLQVEVWSAA